MNEYIKMPVWKLCHLLASGEWARAIEKVESHWKWSVSLGRYKKSYCIYYQQYKWSNATGKMMRLVDPDKSRWEGVDGCSDMYEIIEVKEFKGE